MVPDADLHRHIICNRSQRVPLEHHSWVRSSCLVRSQLTFDDFLELIKPFDMTDSKEATIVRAVMSSTQLEADSQVEPRIKDESDYETMSKSPVETKVIPGHIAATLLSELDGAPEDDSAFTNFQSALVCSSAELSRFFMLSS